MEVVVLDAPSGVTTISRPKSPVRAKREGSSDNGSKSPVRATSEDSSYNGPKSPVHAKNQEKSSVVPNEATGRNTYFSRIQGESMDVEFEDIKYTVSLGFRKGMKEILHGVSGRLPAGKLVAIMGPSGAGKSTLLDVLSGYRITNVEGEVTVNGKPRDLDSFRRTSAYITQDDRLQPLLTVSENMRVAADLKLGTETSKQEKESIMAEILTTLGLCEHLRTRTAQLSGGQRKRLSIALELVNNPTVLFLDEPTTGLDSSSCMQVVKLLKLLAQQGRTIVCTIHQPSASLFQLFDQVYVLAEGECLYHGSHDKLIPYLTFMHLPCPMYHNPADYVIELACGEYGQDKIKSLVVGTDNGKSLRWFHDADAEIHRHELQVSESSAAKNRQCCGLKKGSHATSQLHQFIVLLWRGTLKLKRDSTLTHLRIIVSVFVGLMLGGVFQNCGSNGLRVIDNYNLLFAVLIHHMMSTMMLTILTFPSEMNILTKEHFNRWYSLKAYYSSVLLVDVPILFLCCLLFSIIIYTMSAQPFEFVRFGMFFAISFLVVLVAQGFGLMIGATFNVVNGTFLGPTLSVPMMMFAGFGVSLRDLPIYLKWGSYISYLRYGLEGFIAAIYGMGRKRLECPEDQYCHYRYTDVFLKDVAMEADRFSYDILALVVIFIVMRIAAFYLLRWKLMSSR